RVVAANLDTPAASDLAQLDGVRFVLLAQIGERVTQRSAVRTLLLGKDREQLIEIKRARRSQQCRLQDALQLNRIGAHCCSIPPAAASSPVRAAVAARMCIGAKDSA